MVIYYGLKLISPKFFLATACLVCSVVSLASGTSWGTIGTVGVAFIGIAMGLGIPLGPAAGAIVAGAYFGDKMSPLSDIPNLATVISGSNLFDHIKHMMWSAVPAWLASRGVTVKVVRGRRANAFVSWTGSFGEQPCDAAIELVTAAGEPCGTVKLAADACRFVDVGPDGTALVTSELDQGTRCVWRWWSGLLR